MKPATRGQTEERRHAINYRPELPSAVNGSSFFLLRLAQDRGQTCRHRRCFSARRGRTEFILESESFGPGLHRRSSHAWLPFKQFQDISINFGEFHLRAVTYRIDTVMPRNLVKHALF